MAIKTLYSRQAVQDQFIKEANSMASLNHHHIIQLYGVVLDQPLMLVSLECGGGRGHIGSKGQGVLAG